MAIHQTAIIEDGAELGEGVAVGPYCHIGARVRLGDRCVLHSHVSLSGDTEIGEGAVIYPFAALGGPPQHLAYRGEETKLIIGAGNIIREHVTMNCGTVEGGGVTRVGASGLFMTGSHVAHDCQVGDHAIFANGSCIGGHVILGDHVFMGGLSAVHQRTRIGSFAFVGGCAAVTSDIIPYASVMGNHARLNGLNLIGMKRRGMSRESIHLLRNAYKALFNDEGSFKERLEHVREAYAHSEEAMRIVAFIDQTAARSLMTPARCR